MTGLKLCILVVACAIAAPHVHADLGAAIRRSADAPVVLPHAVSSIAIPLERYGAKPSTQGAPHGGSFYVAQMSIGEPPQNLQVLFDTASGYVILPHRACQSKACLEHRRYSPWESRTAMDVNAKGGAAQEGRQFAKGNVTREGLKITFSQADLGDGDARGVLVHDQACIHGSGEVACTGITTVAATTLDDVPFRAMPHDGIIGLGLEGLTAGSQFNFFKRLAVANPSMLPQFGIAFTTDGGEIFFGGHDRAHITAPIQWFPVARPDQGFWAVSIQSVRVNNVVVDACQEGCRGIIDTGASRLGVLAPKVADYHAALSSRPGPNGGCQGPSLEFELGGMKLTLEPKDYVGSDCNPQLGPLELGGPEFAGVYALGESVLRRYYAAFDVDARKIGFAPMDAQEPNRKRTPDILEDTIFM